MFSITTQPLLLYDETGYLQLLTVLKTVLKVVDNYKRVFDK